MRGVRLLSALRGSMFSVALAALLLPAERPAAQDASRRPMLPGAILVQAVDTSINPIPAEIILPAFELSIRLSEEGVLLLMNVPDGLYLMQARRLGHRPEWRFVRVTGDTSRVEFVLAPAEVRHAFASEGLAASRLREFLRRTGAIPLGSFLTRAEIERRQPRDVLALLGRLPDVVVDRKSARSPVVRSRRAPTAHCPAGMLLLVDGTLPAVGPLTPLPAVADGGEGSRLLDEALQPVRRLGGLSHALHQEAVRRITTAASFDRRGDALPAPQTRGARRALSVLETIPIPSVAAVEVYPILASVPDEFRVAGAECGVVLVWTGNR